MPHPDLIKKLIEENPNEPPEDLDDVEKLAWILHREGQGRD